jgi:hypothetical protein
MKQDELIDAISTTTADDIDQYQVNMACIQRLKYVCAGYGNEGVMAAKMLDMVKDVIGNRKLTRRRQSNG